MSYYVVELILRTLICGLGPVAALLVATDTQLKQIFAIQKKSQIHRHEIPCVLGGSQCDSCSLFTGTDSEMRGETESKVMAYMMVAAVGAAAQSAAFAKIEEAEVEWMKICDMYGKFCNRVGEGITCSVFVCAGMLIVSAISAFNLFRLYGTTSS
ncbi:hypothetical protein L1987_28344 [Smallanthus sonchifolius]|uniref:Uncharacterized protein n=1 Tax=Smallanthus sonchifolius TaxID=185202 RepID=A0ACB9HWP7_9ASTR|nr:hypothetical protein L1987_28344 [Smallanthus sonchifolius]